MLLYPTVEVPFIFFTFVFDQDILTNIFLIVHHVISKKMIVLGKSEAAQISEFMVRMKKACKPQSFG